MVLALSVGITGCANFNSDEPTEVPNEPPLFPEPAPFGGATWRSTEAPTPVTGGHLALLPDGQVAVADPDARELLIVGDIDANLDEYPLGVRARHSLEGTPGRVTADAAGGVHVVLRDAAAIASFDLASGTHATRSVCAEPRGLGYDAATDALFVACLDGRLQRMPRLGGAVETLTELEGGDLRDVVPQPEGLWVTRLRTAGVSLLDRSGALVREVALPALERTEESLRASIAWRAVARPEGGIVISHQRHTNRAISIPAPDEGPTLGSSGGYGGGFDPNTGECLPPLILSAMTELDAAGEVVSSRLIPGSLPVDIALDTDAPLVAMAALEADYSSRVTDVSELSVSDDDVICRSGRFFRQGIDGQAVSIAVLPSAYTRPESTTIVQTRFPARLYVGDRSIALREDGGAEAGERDVGYAIFHGTTNSGLTCTSCHPEAAEDGLTWTFFGVGPRRTQELRGGFLATAPFHWDGDVPSVEHLMNDVFRSRMGGGVPTEAQMQLVASWIDALPLPTLEASEDADHGRAIFEREGCASCHDGAALTNNGFADFGRGMLQVPPLLGVSVRGPWMHDGCATSLEGTIAGSCAGPGHDVSLPEGELGALVGYLRTL